MNRKPAAPRYIQNTAAMFVAACALTVIAAASSFAQNSPNSSAVTQDEAAKIATDAYIYGYPLVTVEMTRRVVTNTAAPVGLTPLWASGPGPGIPHRRLQGRHCAERGHALLDGLSGPFQRTVRAQHSRRHGRYYLLPMLDGWTTVFQVPGKRTTGTKAQTYAITGPGWSGTLPDGVTQYKSPTNMVWIIGRIYCTGTPARTTRRCMHFRTNFPWCRSAPTANRILARAWSIRVSTCRRRSVTR